MEVQPRPTTVAGADQTWALHFGIGWNKRPGFLLSAGMASGDTFRVPTSASLPLKRRHQYLRTTKSAGSVNIATGHIHIMDSFHSAKQQVVGWKSLSSECHALAPERTLGNRMEREAEKRPRCCPHSWQSSAFHSR